MCVKEHTVEVRRPAGWRSVESKKRRKKNNLRERKNISVGNVEAASRYGPITVDFT
jgi:hypothetical protein